MLLGNKGLYSQSYDFASSHVWMWELDNKNTEHWRTGAFELWCWRRLLRVPWTARISNQSIIKEINPEYSLEGLMLRLKIRNFGHLMWRGNLPEKTLTLGKIESRRREAEGEMVGWHHWLNGQAWEQTLGDSGRTRSLKDMEAWHAAVHGGHKKSDTT